VSRDELLQFMRSHKYGLEATVSSRASPQAAVIGFGVTDHFEIVFDTLASSRKAQNLLSNPAISLVIGGLSAGDERTVQLDGIADRPAGTELEQLKEAYYRVFPDGPQRAGWTGLIYVRVRPTWVRFSDFNVSPPQVKEFTAADLSVAG
jgi:hypothetical protein